MVELIINDDHTDHDVSMEDLSKDMSANPLQPTNQPTTPNTSTNRGEHHMPASVLPVIGEDNRVLHSSITEKHTRRGKRKKKKKLKCVQAEVRSSAEGEFYHQSGLYKSTSRSIRSLGISRG